jgi:DNA-binding protein YbaB
MLDNMKMLAAVGTLMKNKDKIAERVKAKLATVEVTGEGGQGAVRATVSGELKVLRVEIAPALANGIAADDRTRQLAGSMIAEAVNNATAAAQLRIKAAIDEEAKSLGFPGGLPDIGGLGGLFGR